MHNREEMRPIGGGKVALSGKGREVKRVYLMGMTRRIPITCIFFMALSVVLSAVWARAQLTDTGTIVGTVQDQSGAAIPAAKVTVTNQATNVQQMTTTNARGEYVVPSLKVGTYSVTVEMSGFQTFVRSGIIVDVQSRVAVDVTMQVGAMTQKVEVTGAPPLLDTQNANEGHLMATQGVVDLPLNGRQYSQLALLTAGVFQRPSGFLGSSVFAGDGYFNVNGNTSFQNNFILDGVDNNSFIENFQGRSAQAAQPPPDALAEFKLQTRTYDPEFGRSAGGVINTQIKSGTNSLHGDAWEFLRNSSLDANDFFLNRAGLKKPEFQQNQFGGTLGGPIVRDKAFIFGAYEGTRIRKGVSFVGTVPTPLMRQFNFSELATPPKSPTLAGLSQFSGCITNAILNPACVDPVAAKVFNLYPLPNTDVGKEGIPGGFTGNNFTSSGKSIDNENNGIVRTDQKIGERDSLFEHFTIFRISLVAPSIFSSVNPIADGAEGQSNFDIRNYNGALGWTHVFNPTTVLDLRAGFNRKFSNGTQFLLGQDVNAQFGLKGIPNFPGVSGGLPDFETISGFNKLGGLAWTPQTQISQVWQFRGILTKIKGAHTIKAGFEWSRNANSYLDVFANRGFFSFSGQYTGQGITDLLLGTPNFVGLTSLTFPHQFADARNLFVQDTWRVTPKLTVNYGLRYELVTPLLERQNHMTNFDPSLRGGQGGLITVRPGASSAADRALQQVYHGAWAPRAGVAYRISDKLVFRTGGGIFYQDFERKGSMALLTLNPPFLTDVREGFAPNQPPAFLLQNGFPAGTVAPVDINNLDGVSILNIQGVDRNLRPGMIEQYSGGFEYSLRPDILLSASWVGNYGHRMWRGVNINQKVLTTPGQPSGVMPFPDFRTDRTVPPVQTSPTNFEFMLSNGNSNYNALLVTLEKRWSKGVSFLASYTASKNIADFTTSLERGLRSTADISVQNRYNLKAEKGLAAVDTPQRLVVSFSAAAPFGKGTNRLNSGAVGRVLEGWQINGILTAQSGQPVGILAPFDASGTGGVERGDCIAKPRSIRQSVDQWFDTSAFAVPALYHFGTCAPATGVRTPGLDSLDFSLFKEIHLTEQTRLEFRAELFNSLNHTQFGPPSNTVGTPGFGSIGSVQVDPREIQFALKFYF